MQNINVVKIGGSVFEKGLDVISRLANEINKVSQKHDFIITVGSGESPHHRTHNDPLGILIRNSNVLRSFLTESGSRSKVIVPGGSDIIRFALQDGYLPIVPFVNVKSLELSYRDDFPPAKSDVNTLLIAEEFNANRCILIKDTYGICSNDPNDPMYRDLPVITLDRPRRLDEEVRDTSKLYLYRNVSISEIKIATENDHLVERMCLELLRKTSRIKCIYIIDAKEPEQLEKLLSGLEVGSKLRKGENDGK